jgi:threonine dehydratase
MRVVESPSTRSRVAPMDLEPVRWLRQRFPEAELRDTAVVRAPDFDLRADPSGSTRVWLALEALQKTGSFKVRGALVALDRVLRSYGPGARIVAASAGNHGAGVAYAAHVLGLAATIVVPANVPRKKRTRMDFDEVTVIVGESDHYDDAEELALALARKTGATFVSAYDDTDVVAGNGGSLGLEIVRALGGVPDLVLAPFGGGGLATGLAHAFANESDECQVRRMVWGVQSEASAAMALSLERGAAVERLPASGPTLAEGLEGGISSGAFQRAKDAVAGVVVVSEEEIAEAMVYASREMEVPLEGSASVALAPLLFGIPNELRGNLREGGCDLLAVLTGRNVDEERLDAARATTVRARFAERPRP